MSSGYVALLVQIAGLYLTNIHENGSMSVHERWLIALIDSKDFKASIG